MTSPRSAAGAWCSSPGPRYTPLAFRDTPLAPLFPMDLDTVRIPDADAVVTESFRPRLTPLGLASPTMQLADSPAANEKLWRERLTPLHWFATVPDLRPGVRVLAEHPTQVGDDGQPLPIIALCSSSARARCCSTRPTKRIAGGSASATTTFRRYWIQTIRYLCRAKLLAAGRTAELVHRPRRVSPRRSRAAAGPVSRRSAGPAGRRRRGRRRPARRGRAAQRHAAAQCRRARRLRGDRRAAGRRQVSRLDRLADARRASRRPSEFTISAPPGELARTRMDTAELTQAAKTSLGKFYRLAPGRQAAGRSAPRPAGADRIAAAAADLERPAPGRAVCCC